jgi:hypothetical protein
VRALGHQQVRELVRDDAGKHLRLIHARLLGNRSCPSAEHKRNPSAPSACDWCIAGDVAVHVQPLHHVCAEDDDGN